MEDGYTWLHAAREGIFYFNYVNRAGYDTQPSSMTLSGNAGSVSVVQTRSFEGRAATQVVRKVRCPMLMKKAARSGQPFSLVRDR